MLLLPTPRPLPLMPGSCACFPTSAACWPLESSPSPPCPLLLGCRWLNHAGVLGHTLVLTTDPASWHTLSMLGYPVYLDRVMPERPEYVAGKGSAPDTPNRWAGWERGRGREWEWGMKGLGGFTKVPGRWLPGRARLLPSLTHDTHSQLPAIHSMHCHPEHVLPNERP